MRSASYICRSVSFLFPCLSCNSASCVSTQRQLGLCYIPSRALGLRDAFVCEPGRSIGSRALDEAHHGSKRPKLRASNGLPNSSHDDRLGLGLGLHRSILSVASGASAVISIRGAPELAQTNGSPAITKFGDDDGFISTSQTSLL